MGAIISVQTDRTIRIEGVRDLGGYNHRALSDRNESASWASAALVTRGDIFVEGASQRDMMTFLNTYRKVGGGMDIGEDGIRFYHRGGKLNPLVLETDVHPGFMTDWQQPLVVALTQAEGVSIVHETVYENRFGFTDALIRMGANIQVHRECLGSVPVPLRPAQLPALRRHLRTHAAQGHRHRRPGPARRLQPPDRRPGRHRHLPGDRNRHHQPRLRALHRKARRPRRRFRHHVGQVAGVPVKESAKSHDHVRDQSPASSGR